MRYMLLIHTPEPQADQAPPTPESMAPWFEYGNWLTDKGWFVAGEQLGPSAVSTTVRVRNGQRLVSDGPFTETKEVLGGYYIVDCPDLDAALESAARCPGAAFGTMEVRPIVDMPESVRERGHDEAVHAH